MQEQQVAFELSKQFLDTAPILKPFDNARKTMQKTDASAHGVGAMLEQEYKDGWHVVAYVSRMLDKHQKNYQISEKELFAIVFACRKFRHYLIDKKFLVLTDHSALQFLNNPKEPHGRLCRWALLLQEYDYVVRYRRGKVLQDADSLSRHPCEDTQKENNDCDIPLYPASVLEVDNSKLLRAEQVKDDKFNAIRLLLSDQRRHELATKSQQMRLKYFIIVRESCIRVD